jgi:hypothetical protein
MILEGLVSHWLLHFGAQQFGFLLQRALDESFWGENNELSGIFLRMLAEKDIAIVQLPSFRQLGIQP